MTEKRYIVVDTKSYDVRLQDCTEEEVIEEAREHCAFLYGANCKIETWNDAIDFNYGEDILVFDMETAEKIRKEN